MEEIRTTIEEPEALAFLEQLQALAELAKARPAAEPASASHVHFPSHGAKAETERFRTLIENLPVVTFVAGFTDEKQELYVSPQIESMLGFTQDEWLDNPLLWYRQLHPDDRDAWVKEFADTCANGTHFRMEYRLMARDGRIVWVQGECQVIRDEHGQPSYIQGIAFDITHRKRANAADELKREAEAASRAKSEFLAHMSHEIRTPLNGVLGMIELLNSTTLNAKQRRYAELAKLSGESLATLVNDILDFSKIEAGKLEIESVPFDLAALLGQVAELQSRAASNKGLAIVCDIDPNIPATVIGDPARVRQIVLNLINNAIKFTAAGTVTVAARIEERGEGFALARVSVSDTGIGIPADRLDRLFKSFSQADASTTRKYGGTGLGLAISKQLAELMGGRIGVQSDAGKGSTFWFNIKVLCQAATAAHETAIAPAQETAPEAPEGDIVANDIRILVAEDNDVNQILLSEILSISGYRHDMVNDGRQAVEAMARQQYDLVLMDCQMPEMDGFEATRVIRQQEAPTGRRTPIIALTANATSTDRDLCVQAGMDAHCTKPIDTQALFDTIEAVLRGSFKTRLTPTTDQPARAAG